MGNPEWSDEERLEWAERREDAISILEFCRRWYPNGLIVDRAARVFEYIARLEKKDSKEQTKMKPGEGLRPGMMSANDQARIERFKRMEEEKSKVNAYDTESFDTNLEGLKKILKEKDQAEMNDDIKGRIIGKLHALNTWLVFFRESGADAHVMRNLFRDCADEIMAIVGKD